MALAAHLTHPAIAAQTTAHLEFQPSSPLSLGVEIEVQLVDWKTLELCPAASRILERLGSQAAIKPEIFQSMLEISTGVCPDLAAVERDLCSARARLLGVADPLGVAVLGIGTHPMDGPSREAVLYPSDRYRMLLDKTQWITTRLCIYGLHVHVGARSGDHAIALMNGVAPYLAHLLCLSASSPFAHGQDTGMASCRSTVFESLPTTGTPPALHNWSEFVQLVGSLRRSRSISHLKDLWWDIRPSPAYGTVEVRICDGLESIDQVLALVAAVKALFTWVDRRWQDGEQMHPTTDWRLRENKWRAARWGMDTELLINDQGHTRRARTEWERLLQIFDSETGASDRRYLARLEDLVGREPCYARQRRLFRETGSLRAVVQQLADDWRRGVASTS